MRLTWKLTADLSSFVGVVDFQFTGWGLCAEDIAYLLYPDARGGSLMCQVDELLDFYHEQLVTQLMLLMKGGPSSISVVKLIRLFELSILDLTRYWLSKGWEGTTKGEAGLVLRMEATLNAIDNGSLLEDNYAYSVALQTYHLETDS